MRLLAAANLIPITWYGDWDRTPLTPASSEFIVVACRANRRPLQNCAQLHDVTNPFESVLRAIPRCPA
jgi:hypothetical protein